MRRTALVGALVGALVQVGGCGGRSVHEEGDASNPDGGTRSNGGANDGRSGAKANAGGKAGRASGGRTNGTGATAGETAATSSSGGASNDSGGTSSHAGRTSSAGGNSGSGSAGRASGQAGTMIGIGNRGGDRPTGGTGGSGGDTAMNGGAAGETPLEDSGDIVDTALVVDLDTQKATATITLAASSATSATFEVGDLQIDSVSAGSGLAGLETRDGKLRVEYVRSTEPVVLTVAYHYRNHDSFDGVSQSGYTFTWPYYCGNVFPCHSDPADGTRFTLSLTGDASQQLVYPARIDAEAPSYMAAWTAGDYQKLDLGTTTAGTHVTAYYLADAGTGATNMAYGAVNVLAGFDWLEQHYGPYAFGSEVGPVSVRWQNTQFDGMEHHPFWHIREPAVVNQLTQLHEMSHGWFGDGVRIRCWEDFVLSEGLATYLAARLGDEFDAFSVSMWDEYELVLSQGLATDAIVAWPDGCNQIDVLASGLDSNMTYVKGALFLRALEKRLGTAAFDTALAYFYAKWVGQAAGVQDLLDAVEHSSGYHAQECANHWLRSLSPRDQACQ